MRRLYALCTLLLLLFAAAAAQQVPAPALDGLTWRSIGPATTGGRIADLAAAEVPGEPETMYVGTASGGVFKSSNAGVSWTPVFDHSGGMMSIGAVAVAPSNPSIVWVGTGEVDNRQSSSWGNGIYKSLDGGATWQFMGLEQTRAIAKILIDPHNADVVYVAALGHLWGSNPERGVFKTMDGGKSWTKVLYVDDNTGATDLAMSPQDPNLLFAAMYQRQRKGWGFNGGGPGSAIYRSSDGGASWTKLSVGLPQGVKGRIGLTIFPTDPRIVYAIIEADASARPAPGAKPKPRQGGIFRSRNQGRSWEHMSGVDPRPMYYSRIYVDPHDANRIYIMGSERGFYVSGDGGRTFSDVFSRVHGEDHVMWIDPRDSNHFLVGGDGGVSISFDRGRTWLFRDNLPIGQFYNISVSQGTPYLICGGLQDNGNWCTPSATNLSYGLSNRDAFNVGGGDGMQAVFDGNNYTLLVSSQNGSTNRVDLRTMQRQNIGPVRPVPDAAGHTTPYRWNWTSPLIVSHFDPQVIYTGANRVFRSGDQGRSWQVISPDLTAQIDRDKLIMMGGPIPPHALSRNDGQDNYGALTVIAESPLDRQLLYTGADDGTLEVTSDGGAHWSNLTARVAGLPAITQVSGLVASRYAAGRIYATFDGHFNDDYRPHVYVSEDYGQTWREIDAGLPTSVHRLRENPTNPDFLVVGTEEGVYASWDRGEHWTPLNTNLPPVPVYDLVYADGAHNLVLGTHGRGLWVLDETGALVGAAAAAAGGRGHLFPITAVHRRTIYSPQAWFGWGEFFAPNPPAGAVVSYWLPQAARATATFSVRDAQGELVRQWQAPAAAGLNQTVWDLHWTPPQGSAGSRFFRPSGPWAAPGSYAIQIAVRGQTLNGKFTLTPDPQAPLAPAQMRERENTVMSAYRLQLQLEPAGAAVHTLAQQLAAMRAYCMEMGAAGAAALSAVERGTAALGPHQTALARARASAASSERAMDNFEGLPTAAEQQELARARKGADTAIRGLNRFLANEMRAVYAAVPAGKDWPRVKPISPPRR
ncbi:MAG: VPS10 domain-containing protein [Terriglobales bacterium]